MDKEKVLTELDNAKKSDLKIRIGCLKPMGTSNDLKYGFEITYNYVIKNDSMIVEPITEDNEVLSNETISFKSIIDFEVDDKTLLILIYMDRA